MQTYKVTDDNNGIIFWYNEEGNRHREDGPAVEYPDGQKEYFINDKRHREDGPAVECADGSKSYFINDELHRLDGPAIEWADGTKAYWINGVNLTEKEFNNRNKKEMTVK